MSDTTEYASIEVDPTFDSGQVENVGSETPEVEANYFEWDEYADHKVKVPVAGEEVEVPLREALAGYQRQADYTRKTQELSQQRQQVQFAAALQEALENDPAATVELLTKHYGLDANSVEAEDEFLDPGERQIRMLEKRIASFEEQQALQEIERTVSSLQARYGEDFDANQVVAKALATGNSDLEAVYKQIAFDRLWESNKMNNSQRQKEQQIVEAKRQTGVVSGVAGGAASAAPTTAPVSSLRDAFDLAKRQLGIS
jgi:hypothetical protein